MRRIKSLMLAGVLGLAALPAMAPATAMADVFVSESVDYAPPPLPIYDQPPIPAPGYIWTPGYWAWDGDDYYWVPGTWVLPPEAGLLWTPAWWGWDDGAYIFHTGYWAPVVGFYGGINYGCGYNGFGYEGGYWDHNRFFYNRTVNNITNVNVTNVYNRSVAYNTINRVSYNGGAGGIAARPTPAQMSAARSWRIAPTSAQTQNQHAAAGMPLMRAANNRGAPPVAATARPAVFTGSGVVPAAHAGGYGRPGSNAPTPPRNPAQANNQSFARPAEPRPSRGEPYGAYGAARTPAPAQNSAPYPRSAPNERAYAPPQGYGSERNYPRPPAEARPAPGAGQSQAQYRSAQEYRQQAPAENFRAPPQGAARQAPQRPESRPQPEHPQQARQEGRRQPPER